MIYLELDDVLAIACEVLGLEVGALLHVTDLALADSASWFVGGGNDPR